MIASYDSYSINKLYPPLSRKHHTLVGSCEPYFGLPSSSVMELSTCFMYSTGVLFAVMFSCPTFRRILARRAVSATECILLPTVLRDAARFVGMAAQSSKQSPANSRATDTAELVFISQANGWRKYLVKIARCLLNIKSRIRRKKFRLFLLSHLQICHDELMRIALHFYSAVEIQYHIL